MQQQNFICSLINRVLISIKEGSYLAFYWRKILFSYASFWLFAHHLNAQNLVPNPSFETVENCPSNNIFTAADWYNPTMGSPDNFHPCGSGWTIPPANVLFGPQTAHSGESFAGIGWYGLGGGWYEYMQVELTASLEQGETYEVSMWVHLADVKKASDDLGIYISKNPFKSSANILPAVNNVISTTPANFGVFTTLTPQIKCPTGNFIKRDTKWTLISGLYIADGGEQYLTIGCFEPWATTGKLDIGTNTNDRCYYFIDDVSVVKSNPLPIELISFEVFINDNSNVEINWKTASEINVQHYEIEKSSDGKNFISIHNYLVEGNSTHTKVYSFVDKAKIETTHYYRLKTVDYDGRTEYSAIKSVSFNPTGNQFVLYPNPVKENLFIQCSSAKNEIVEITLYNTLGEIQLQWQKSTANLMVIPMVNLPSGIYKVSIQTFSSLPFLYKVVKL